MYRDRRHAGRALAERLGRLRTLGELVVLALPRGGLPVGYEVARALGAPLDVFVVRKLGVPGHEELAMGAIASGGVRVLNDEVVRELGIGERAIEQATARELAELRRRETLYRDGGEPLDITGKHVVIVDDGLATGATMRAAVEALRGHAPASITVAVPVASMQACRALEGVADDVVCAATPEPFRGVGLWYEDFSPTTDEDVRTISREARGLGSTPRGR